MQGRRDHTYVFRVVLTPAEMSTNLEAASIPSVGSEQLFFLCDVSGDIVDGAHAFRILILMLNRF